MTRTWLFLGLCILMSCSSSQPDQAMSPYPESPIITGVTWAPVTTIVRQALGGDNWPITWGDDGHLYTSYGDGRGFKPYTDKKLSLGLARLLGGATEFRGMNIHSRSGERFGDGPTGEKASGMLMVDGVLYMLARNAGNSRIAWSTDHGKSWEWGFRFKSSFGHPVFLNFGKNYEGARDEYVYVYSPDGPSAYESYDRVVLARVRKRKIRERAAYEYFEGLDADGRPSWTPDLSKRQGVFTNPGKCSRMDVVYHPGLKRYLMAVASNRDAGWGIFDAPEPWGPWTTVFYTRKWDVGKIHSYRLPSKWIGADNKTMYVVFSGRTYKGVSYDAFSVRKMELRVTTALETR